MTRARSSALVLLVVASVASAFSACVEPPPKIASIPPSGLALRLHVFGASAQEARDAFQAVRQNNKNFVLVRERDRGDGELLVGLENDSPKCVAPTALCSFKVALRIRNNAGKVVYSGLTQVSANAERCADLCEKALNSMVVKAIDTAVATLKPGAGDASDGGMADGDVTAGGESSDAGESVDAAPPPVSKAAPKKVAAKSDKSDAGAPSSKEPPICAIARGPQLRADEAERRAAQVEVLHRIEVLDQEEYDCLRKAYLDRL